MKTSMTVADLRPDPQNANDGTDRGRTLLGMSIDTGGWARPIVADRNLTVIGGNKTLREAQARHAPIEVVPVSGDELVVVQRMDLDLAVDPAARALAYYDNRVAEVDLSWNTDRIGSAVLDGLDLSVGFHAEELTALLPDPPPGGDFDAASEPHDMTSLPPETRGAKDFVADAADVPPATPLLTWEMQFDSKAACLRWRTFLRLLGKRYPQIGTDGGRVARYLSDQGAGA